jgi:3-isopropylmalate/(R)-2-methylmalate dehydratase small subunit
MQPFRTITGIAAPLPAANLDTDVIMPKQFLKGIDRRGLDRGVFFDLRFAPRDRRAASARRRAPWRWRRPGRDAGWASA